MNVIVKAGSLKKGADMRNTVCAKNPPQLKYFRTCSVVKYPFTWHTSAKYPAIMRITPITPYGAADKNPAFSSLKPKLSENGIFSMKKFILSIRNGSNGIN